MAATTLKFATAPARTAPRGANWAASAFATVLKSASSLIRSYQAQRRLEAEAEARQQLLRLADSYASSQPGFASDLRAAALRSSDKH